MHSEVYTVLLTMMEQGSYTQVTARNAIGKVYGYQLITDAECDELMAKASELQVNASDGALLVRLVEVENAVKTLTEQVCAIKEAVEQGSTTVPDPQPGQTGAEDDPIDAVPGMSYRKDTYYRDPTNGEVYLCTVDVSYAGLPHEAVNVYFNWARKE